MQKQADKFARLPMFYFGGFVVDHSGKISEQIDIIIYDRHFTPFIFKGERVVYIPVEGVYAIFEVRPQFNKKIMIMR